MAKLILVKREANPWNSDGDVLFAYFEGTPTPREIKALQKDRGYDGDSTPEQVPDEISRRAGLERWFFTQAV